MTKFINRIVEAVYHSFTGPDRANSATQFRLGSNQPNQRFEILLSELNLIQSTLSKYDDLVFKNRSWLVTLWTPLIGASFTFNAPFLALLAFVISLLYYGLEGALRHQHVFRYAERYRRIRNALNESRSVTPEEIANEMAVYDLSNHFERIEMERSEKYRHELRRFKESFLRPVPILFYISMSTLALLVYCYLR